MKPISAIKVVVVDDNAFMREAVCTMLTAFGFSDIKKYANGIFAGKDIPKNFADLVICDYLMEPIDGIEVLKTFRSSKHKEISTIPFILMSAFRDVETVVDAYFASCTEFILKPFSPDVFFERICSVLSGHDKFVLTDSIDGIMPNTSIEVGIHIQSSLRKQNQIRNNNGTAAIDPSCSTKAKTLLGSLKHSYQKLVYEELVEMDQEIDWVRRNTFDKQSFRTLLSKAHDINGTALMFGNGAIAEVAKDFSRLLRSASRRNAYLTKNSTALIDQIDAYVDRLKSIARTSV